MRGRTGRRRLWQPRGVSLRVPAGTRVPISSAGLAGPRLPDTICSPAPCAGSPSGGCRLCQWHSRVQSWGWPPPVAFLVVFWFGGSVCCSRTVKVTSGSCPSPGRAEPAPGLRLLLAPGCDMRPAWILPRAAAAEASVELCLGETGLGSVHGPCRGVRGPLRLGGGIAAGAPSITTEAFLYQECSVPQERRAVPGPRGVTELFWGGQCFTGKWPMRGCRSSRGLTPCRGHRMAAPGSRALGFNAGRGAGRRQAGFLSDGRPWGRWSAVTSCAHAGGSSSRWGCRAWASSRQRQRRLRCACGPGKGHRSPGELSLAAPVPAGG